MQIYKIRGFDNIHYSREDAYGGTSIHINKIMPHKFEICKSNKFVELICLTLSSIKID